MPGKGETHRKRDFSSGKTLDYRELGRPGDGAFGSAGVAQGCERFDAALTARALLIAYRELTATS